MGSPQYFRNVEQRKRHWPGQGMGPSHSCLHLSSISQVLVAMAKRSPWQTGFSGLWRFWLLQEKLNEGPWCKLREACPHGFWNATGWWQSLDGWLCLTALLPLQVTRRWAQWGKITSQSHHCCFDFLCLGSELFISLRAEKEFSLAEATAANPGCMPFKNPLDPLKVVLDKKKIACL